MSAPQKLVLVNQFGEESINVVEGSYLPLPGTTSIIIMNGATAPVDGTTGDNIAGKGSIYIAQDTGLMYLQTSLITTPVWTILEAGAASVIATAITGFVSGAGTVGATDTILQAFNKVSGNLQNRAVIANLLTGYVSGAGTVAATDTILQAVNKLNGNQVLSKATADAALPAAGFTSAAIKALASFKASHQADSVAADVAAMVVDFNALLAKLQAAGFMT